MNILTPSEKSKPNRQLNQMNILTLSEKSKSNRRLLPAFASLLLLGAVSPAVADTLYSISTTNTGGGNAYNQSGVSVSVAAGLTSNIATAQNLTDMASANGLTIYNGNWAGFSVLSSTTFASPSALTSSNWLTTKAFTFTLTRQEGYEWDLSSLTFLGARGGTGGFRGFELFASIDGVNDFNTDLLINETAAGVNGGMSTAYSRTSPHPYSVDLTDPRYADATSITFRYIPVIQTHSPAYSVEFSGFTVNGTITAVPEPATWGMVVPISLGILVVAFRIRRRGNLSPAGI